MDKMYRPFPGQYFFRRSLFPFLKTAAFILLFLTSVGEIKAGTPPLPGDIIFNEYATDNNASANDFFELLVLGDNLDLRGLRVSDNELIAGTLNNGESVFIFGNDAYLNNVPRGTVITVWTLTAGVTPDVTINPALGDWKLVLAPGTGVSTSVDGLGGSLSVGLETNGEALYLYLPGPDGTSAGTDNIYLDFISSEGGNGATAPAGLTYIDLPSLSDNAYYTGITASGNDVAANWVAYDAAPNYRTTAGDPNLGQEQALQSLRTPALPAIRITEYMYDGANSEFVEFTNVGTTAINMSGWSYDDDSRIPGTFSLTAFGTVQPGESVVLSELAEASFRTAWNLCVGIKIIGGLNTNLGRGDEINLFDANGSLIDRLTFGDQNFPGTIRTQNKSGWVNAAGTGKNLAAQWALSASADTEASYASAGGDIGSPGKSTRATVTFNPCTPPANGAPVIQENTVSTFVNLATNNSGSLSGVINAPSDPAKTAGIDFTLSDTETPAGDLVLSVVSSNQTVVPNANLLLSGSGGTRNLKITPASVGYATITVTLSDGVNSSTYVINYAASAASVNPATTRFHTGASDASTAISLDADYMLVGDDEGQALRLYNRHNSGLPLAQFDFSSSLGLSGNSEVDIEGSTRAGNRIYWIGSHGNNMDGEDRPNRERIFATDISGSGSATTLSFAGYYKFLEDDMIAWDNSNGHGLGTAYLGLAASAASGVIPENDNGFNIEGLTFAPGSTSTAYVSFRAPIEPNSNRVEALIIPVTNFNALPGISSAGASVFGAPILLNLGGRGIRSIECNSNGCLLIAGPTDSDGEFSFFTWSGNPADQPVERTADFSALNALGSFETIVELPSVINENSLIQVLVDNGTTLWYNDGTASKDLPDPNIEKFRSEWITVGAPLPFSLSGSIDWSRNSSMGVQNTTINLSGSATATALTAANGDFTFSGLNSGNYTLTPAKNLNKMNGITIGDALAIQQHVNTQAPFTNAFDWVAADVNGSNSISSADVTLINQCLLGNAAALSQFKTSWRFVPKSYSLPTPPWGFLDKIVLTNVNSTQNNLDFYGIKIGDVFSEFANPAGLAAPADFVLRVNDQSLQAGSTIQVHFRADQLNALSAWQFALHFDPEMIRLLDIKNGDSFSGTADIFNTNYSAAGELRSAWMPSAAIDVAEAAEVFTLRFSVLQGGKRLREVLRFEEAELPALCYNTQLKEHRVRLVFEQSTGTGDLAGGVFQLQQNVPNPFNDRTGISFELPAQADAQLRVYDMTGRVMLEKQGSFDAGLNQFELDLSAISVRGVLYYELITPFGNLSKAMLRN